MPRPMVVLAALGLGGFIFTAAMNKLIHEKRKQEARMGDDERLAQVQHEEKRESIAHRVVMLGLVGLGLVGMWTVLLYGVSRSIDMGGQ